MTRTALLTVPLLVALLAGCAGSGGDTAKSLRAIADGEAAGWDPDAFLVSAIGIEANINLTAEERAFVEKAAKEHAEEQDAEDVLTLLSDPRVGDGIAPGWAFAYASPRGLYVVAVGADRRIVHSEAVNLTDLPNDDREEFQSELEQMRPIIEEGIAAWSVDSAQAANALAAANGTFAAAVGKPDQIAAWALNPVERTWEMFLMPAKGKGLRMAASISYENGSVLEVKVFGMPKVQVPTEVPVAQAAPAQTVKQEAGQVSGSVSLLSSTDSGSFMVKNEHDAGTLVFETDEQLVGSSTITITVTSPTGTEYEANLGSMFGSDETSMDFVPEEGEWQVEMMAGGVTTGTDVTVSWCTDGEPNQNTAGNPACGGFLVISVNGPPEAAPQRTGPFSRWMPF